LSVSHTIGGITARRLKGFATIIIANEWVETQNFEKMEFEYDAHYQNIFLIPAKKENDAFQFSKGKPLKISNKTSICIKIPSSGTWLSSKDDIDTVFLSNNENKFNQLKEVMAPFFEDKSFILLQRTTHKFITVIEKENSNLNDLMDLEGIWRFLWEIIVDHPISINSFWIYSCHKSGDDKITFKIMPSLCTFYKSDTSSKNPKALYALPVNFYSFGSNNKSLSVVRDTLLKWQIIHQDPKWAPVLNGLRKLLEARNNLIDTATFVSLISDVETFLDLLDEKSTNCDQLIKLYASKDWKKNFSNIANNKSDCETYGQWIADIRNTIVHPKSAQKKKEGKYLEIAQDCFKLHYVYSHVGGLFLKANLMNLGGINKDHVEKFTNEFIKVRCSFHPITFDE
jgi:hypothetical protein